MDIKPVPSTRPPAPVLKVAERKDPRREQGGRQVADRAPLPDHEASDGSQHVDAYA